MLRRSRVSARLTLQIVEWLIREQNKSPIITYRLTFGLCWSCVSLSRASCFGDTICATANGHYNYINIEARCGRFSTALLRHHG